MATFTIDGVSVEAKDGQTVMQAARASGIPISSMCYAEGHEPQNSCLLCVIKIGDNPNLVPSCSRPAEEGMVVESESEEVREVRRTALELMLSDHVGDCFAPCTSICPAKMEIPQMLRQVSERDYLAAIKTIKRDIPFPSVMGRICAEVCEGGCRRGTYDKYESICMVERFVGDEDLMSENSWVPSKKAHKNKKVAIVGSGLTGLTAAYYLLLEGYSCTIFEKDDIPGGSMLSDYSEEKLPRVIVEKEVAKLKDLGLAFQTGVHIGTDKSLEELRSEYDAVLVAMGSVDNEKIESIGLKSKTNRPVVDKKTLSTSLDGIFAGGAMLHKKNARVYSIAAGKSASISIDQYLSSKPLMGRAQRFNSRSGKLTQKEVTVMLETTVSREGRYSPSESTGTSFSQVEKPGFTQTMAKEESDRCLHCDCRAKDNCDLRDLSEYLDAKQRHYAGVRRPIERLNQNKKLLLDSGKCIQCGLCIQISQDGEEKLGLAYEGRGFSTKVVVPFGRSLDEALTTTAKPCVEACPTGALEFLSEEATEENPVDYHREVTF